MVGVLYLFEIKVNFFVRAYEPVFFFLRRYFSGRSGATR